MGERTLLFGFSLDERLLALPLGVVQRAFFSVEVTLLPGASEIIAGVINYHGTVLPVVDIRVRFGSPKKEILPSDRFVLIRTPKRMLVVIASDVTGVMKPSVPVTPPGDILPGSRYITGLTPGEERLILIYDPDAFLSLDEETALETALAGAGAVQ
jgi:chemotaxis signal transduction protein